MLDYRCCDIGPDDAIGQDRWLLNIANRCKALNEANGRPCRDIVLKGLDWGSNPCRCYETSITQHSKVLVGLTGMECIEIDVGVAPAELKKCTAVVGQNWSKLKAQLKIVYEETGEVKFSCNVSQFFAYMGQPVFVSRTHPGSNFLKSEVMITIHIYI